jgi:PilZ domain
MASTTAALIFCRGNQIMTDERRSSSRKRILLEAKWDSMSHAHEARVDDVSLGGCFVNTYGRVELDEAVNLQILMPSGEWLPLSGRVASYQPGVGFGLSFDPLTDEEIADLRELIETSEEKLI